jgi:hypothetical protein
MTCHKKKPAAAFSAKQITDVRFKLWKKGQGRGNKPIKARCRECNEVQVSFLHCVICDKNKQNEKFSLAQRKTPDNAVGATISLELRSLIIE